MVAIEKFYKAVIPALILLIIFYKFTVQLLAPVETNIELVEVIAIEEAPTINERSCSFVPAGVVEIDFTQFATTRAGHFEEGINAGVNWFRYSEYGQVFMAVKVDEGTSVYMERCQ